MRVAIVNHARYDETSFNIAGTTLAGRLYLYGDPTMPMEATTKRYVDNVALSINAGSISTGTLNSARMPGVTGDFTSADGSANLTLTDSGIVAGTYTKLTIDSSGRALVGLGVGNGDLPLISWSKIVNNKPTTLEGYGINDGVINTSPTLTGYASLPGDPVSGTQLATKQYVDALAAGGSSLKVADTIRRPSSITPSGFLRCNGGEVSQTTYSALYAIIGDTYSGTLMPGSGKPWEQQYFINSEQSTDITGWTTGTSIPAAACDFPAIVTKNRVYLIGGANGPGDIYLGTTVRTAPINADGTLGTWTTGTPMPDALYNPQAIVTKNRVHLLGGNSSSTVYTAPINADGTLGTWTTGTSLPGALRSSQAIVTKNRVYLLGSDDVGISAFCTAPINADGTLGTWTTITPFTWTTEKPSSSNAYGSHAIVTKNRVYLLGWGDTYTAPINSDGTLGAWTRVPLLPGTTVGSHAIVTKNRVYLLGGDGSSTVCTAPINTDGTLGTWSTGTSLPGRKGYGAVLVTSSRVYILGGRPDTSDYNVVSTVYSAPFAGGLNDYSAYYDGTYTATTTGNFNLPDTTLTDVTDIFTYIKY